jgi:hypothetical protein
MAYRTSRAVFVSSSVGVWVLMTIILVVVPDWLDRWVSLEIARVVGWAVAVSVWVLTVEQQWKERFGPFLRFLFQLVLWVGAALTAIYISEQATP